MTKCAELLNQTIDVDFVDINVGCPIDLVYKKVSRCLQHALFLCIDVRRLHCFLLPDLPLSV